MSTHRGHKMYLSSDDDYLYSDTHTPVSDDPDRACGHCGRANTVEGHDGCLGILPNVMNACCGHGNDRQAYVQFEDGNAIHGRHAMKTINQLSTGG